MQRVGQREMTEMVHRELLFPPLRRAPQRGQNAARVVHQLLAAGTPEWYVELLVTLETGAESGRLGALTTTLRDLLGRAPRSVEEFLTEHAARFTTG
jgi:hypothetical protein